MKIARIMVVTGAVLFCRVAFAESLVGQKAPQITIRQWVTEDPPDLKRLENKVYVVEFWATWCHSCVQSIPHLIELNDKYADKGVEFISLSQDKSPDMLRQFVRDKQVNYNVAVDNGTTDWYGIKGYPTVVIVNHEGKIVWQGYPWSSGFEKELNKALAAAPPPLLAGIDLGPFDSFRRALRGGKKFGESYRKIEAHVDNWMSPKHSEAARRIINTINLRIAQRIGEADRIAAAEPEKAYQIYSHIVDRYGAIKAAEPARAARLELRKRKLHRKGLLMTVSDTDPPQ